MTTPDECPSCSLPERITIDDGNPAGPRIYYSGKVVEAMRRERDEARDKAESERTYASIVKAENEQMRRVVEAVHAVALDHTCTEFTPDEHDPDCPECVLARLLQNERRKEQQDA